MHCGKSFVNPINHKCKARNCIPGALFNFSDSLFESYNIVSINNEADQASFLDNAFSSDNYNQQSPFVKDLLEFTSFNSNTLKIGLLNINSLHSHEINFLLEKCLLDVFVLNETKFDLTIDSSDYENSRYHLYRRDRTRHGGGIIVYVKKEISIKSMAIDPEAEIIRLTLNVKNEPDIGVIACYRPESINSDFFYDKLEQHTLDLLSKSTNVIVVGEHQFTRHSTKPTTRLSQDIKCWNTTQPDNKGVDSSRRYFNPLY